MQIQGLGNKKLYNGKDLVDDFGLNWYHYGARWYDPQLGRWTTMDPADEFHSPYSYVGNDPVNLVDPDGRQVGVAISEWVSSLTSFNPVKWFKETMGMDPNSPNLEMKSEEQIKMEQESHPMGLTVQQFNQFQFAVVEDNIAMQANAIAFTADLVLSGAGLFATGSAEGYILTMKAATLVAGKDATRSISTGNIDFTDTGLSIFFGLSSTYLSSTEKFKKAGEATGVLSTLPSLIYSPIITPPKRLE